jgi:RNA polymerase sigma-70 factor (ECF subfamily)
VTDDEALIRAAQAGDADAFERLLERHYDTVYRFAYKWCGNRPDAEDVTQQACLKLARGLGSYRFDSAFTTWLYRVVINCAKDWKRTQQRGSGDPLDDGAPAEASAGVDNPVERHAYLWQLLRKLDQLPDGIKETLLLVHAEGMSHGEAAQVLAVKESTVSWRLHEFRKHYRGSPDQGGICEYSR